MKESLKILVEAYEKALRMVENNTFKGFKPISTRGENIDLLISKIETDKSLVQVVVTSILKKIITPEQDIRIHMAKLENGYSARVLDTQVTTPFFKKYFPKYANKETAFLTKATRD